MSDWYLWCPACDAYWTVSAREWRFPSLDDKHCPRCGGELKAGTVIYDRPTAPLLEVGPGH